MKKGYKFLIIGIILVVLTIVGFVLYKTEVKENTYVANLRLEATSGYPPHLTQIVNEGITKETVLVSIMPTLNFRGLTITEPYAFMSGTIKIDCGESQETKDFYISTNNPGDKMVQTFVFKDIPSEEVCFIVAQALDCGSQYDPPICTKNSISLMVRTS